MPAIFNPSDLTTAHFEGVARVVLANPAMLGSEALGVVRLALDPGARTPTAPAENAERFLYVIYVIGGAGTARVGDQSFALEPESILWLDPGDAYSLEAGEQALEVLVCRAPASKDEG